MMDLDQQAATERQGSKRPASDELEGEQQRLSKKFGSLFIGM
jgi:hypothetical protein